MSPVLPTLHGHVAELGIISAKGRNGTAELLEIIANPDDDRIPAVARLSLAILARQYAAVTTEIGAIEKSTPGTGRAKIAGGWRKSPALARSSLQP